MNNNQKSFFSPPLCQPGNEQRCSTCADDVTQVRVILIDKQTGLALVEAEDQLEEVDTMLIEEVNQGDTLLVHGGVAIARLL